MQSFFNSILLLILFSYSLSAQDEVDEYHEELEFEISKVQFAEATFSIYTPSGAFLDKIDKSVLTGFSIAYLKQLKKEGPAFLGGELYHMHLGSLSRTYAEAFTDEVIDVTGKLSSNTIGLNFIGRYYSTIKLGPVEPFFEVHFGGKWLYAYLSESGVFSDEEQYSNFETESSSFSLTYGGGIGAQIHLNSDFYLIVKGSYQGTNSSEYLKRIEDEPGVFPLLPMDGFESVRSSTDTFKYDVGITFLF